MPRRPTIPDCPVCLIPCDPDIHEATLDVHAWFRELVTIAPEPVKPGKIRANPDAAFQIPPPTRIYRTGSMSDGERRA
jgi:hypothetical protein